MADDSFFRGIPIRWVQDFDGARHHPETGRGQHGEVSIGTVFIAKSRDVGASEDAWGWSMTVTGAGADYARHRGVAASKEAAIEACNACYIALMAIEGNYERAVAHHRDLRERMARFAGEHERRID